MAPQGRFNFAGEAQARDAALSLLEERRRSLVASAKSVAEQLAARNGKVTSTEVFTEMKLRGIDIGDVDKRFMGCVFRAGWERVGFVSTGSHRRPISVWRLA